MLERKGGDRDRSASGIGKAIAQRFASEGAFVIMTVWPGRSDRGRPARNAGPLFPARGRLRPAVPAFSSPAARQGRWRTRTPKSSGYFGGLAAHSEIGLIGPCVCRDLPAGARCY